MEKRGVEVLMNQSKIHNNLLALDVLKQIPPVASNTENAGLDIASLQVSDIVS